MANNESTQPQPESAASGRELERGSLSSEELEAQQASELPDREAMSLINANVAIPVNAAIAANVLSDGSTAIAWAEQDTPIDQST